MFLKLRLVKSAMVHAMLSKQFFRTLRIVVMPKLSPTMNHGKLIKLNLKENQSVSSYEKIMEVSTSSLLNTSVEESVMEIEIMEDMFVASLCAAEGQELAVGCPIAVLCDNAADIAKVQSMQVHTAMANTIIQHNFSTIWY